MDEFWDICPREFSMLAKEYREAQKEAGQIAGTIPPDKQAQPKHWSATLTETMRWASAHNQSFKKGIS